MFVFSSFLKVFYVWVSVYSVYSKNFLNLWLTVLHHSAIFTLMFSRFPVAQVLGPSSTLFWSCKLHNIVQYVLLVLNSCFLAHWLPFLHSVAHKSSSSFQFLRCISTQYLITREFPLCWKQGCGFTDIFQSLSVVISSPGHDWSDSVIFSAIGMLCLAVWHVWVWLAKFDLYTKECESVVFLPEFNDNLCTSPISLLFTHILFYQTWIHKLTFYAKQSLWKSKINIYSFGSYKKQDHLSWWFCIIQTLLNIKSFNA